VAHWSYEPPTHLSKDSPAEKWGSSHFGTRPADWSGGFDQSMREFYRIVLPVSLKLERWNDINPRSGVVNELRLVLRLPVSASTGDDTVTRLNIYRVFKKCVTARDSRCACTGG